MAYEKARLVVAGVSGNIYMTQVLKDGLMSDKRREVTNECLGASTEWFMRNGKKMVQYPSTEKGEKPTLFFTNDQGKAKRILEILEEE